jgi:hypothetical protein
MVDELGVGGSASTPLVHAYSLRHKFDLETSWRCSRESIDHRPIATGRTTRGYLDTFASLSYCASLNVIVNSE